ncbi:hypothetical protein N7541_002638 [Penicillium brevicompactum]|uniref:Cysteine-rich transmembrane CYSTM domain-containing protein n=1 Tax=Penicillium brevicompactum TaxID=5074 RepID=A0A9W9UZ12_PENBR|nr:uncharacterized protein N7506_006617 [Penicillium brevicompactum]KAJ5332834.1 hypothetical protein N7506_006617 [Penicillium brevicompactum]KAJ5361794.1 hypothetical protein N7541_002638 [Penicillium brevicompactum]
MSYNKPMSPPPSYPAPTHDAGPYNQNPGAATDYYGGGQPQQGYYPQQGQGYPQQQQGYYPQQQQPMYYPPQQQGYPPQQYNDRGNHSSGGGAGGICAGIMAACACCCCLDILF